MVSYDIIALFDFDMFALKNLYAFVKLIDFQFDIGILLTILSVVVILISKLSLKIVEFIFILPFEFVWVLVIFYLQEFHLIVLFFLKLSNCFLFVADFLHVFVLMNILFIA